MIRIVDITEKELSPEIFGGKAAGLSKLIQQGYLVPDGIAIEAVDSDTQLEEEFQKHLKERLKRFEYEKRYEVAVRSSCTIEDTLSETAAGKYETFLGEMSFIDIVKAIKKIVKNLSVSGTKMGIIIQQLIKAEYSGVIFSSDPFTYKKNGMLVSYTEGLGNKLVSGEMSGTDIPIIINDGEVLFAEKKKYFSELETICIETKHIEHVLGYPVDIEWAVSGGKIYYLQCRPLTVITGISSGFAHVNSKNIDRLSREVDIGDKLEIWKELLELKIKIPDTYLYIYNDCKNQTIDVKCNIKKSEEYKGYSAVVLHPENQPDFSGCSYLGDGTRVKGYITNCCRYGIRTFPQYGSIEECINTYDNILSEQSWIVVTMLQETLKPAYTGSIRRIEEGYVIEITHGNFVTKGVVPVSRYMIDMAKGVILKNEVNQTSWYELVEGHTVYCICNEEEKNLVSISEDEIRKIFRYFKQVLERYKKTIEFGILRKGDCGIQPYFMDFVDEGESNGLSFSEIYSGIISRGKMIGKIQYIDKQDIDILCKSVNDEAKVFFCKKPDIAFLPLVEAYSNRNVAFVFSEGSVLCHLATILRERNIPAIQTRGYNKWNYPEGRKCELDAQTENILEKDRISLI